MANNFSSQNPLSYSGLDPYRQPKFIDLDRAPTVNDWQNFLPGDQLRNTSTSPPEVWELVSLNGNQATWKKITPSGSGSSSIDQLAADSGSAVPTSAGVVTIAGGSGVVTSASGSTVTVSLTGGGIAIDQINVDANSAPGTDPVVPTATGEITITGAQVATGTVGANVIRTDSLAANSLTIEIQRTTAAAATDSTLNGVSHFDSSQFSVDANGFVTLAGGGTAIDSFIPDAGTNPVVPDGAGAVTMAGGNGIQTTGGTNTLTFDMQSPFTGDFTFTDSTAGNTESVTVTQTDNTAANASSAAVNISVAGTTQIGDPYLNLAVGSTRAYALGPDTTDSQILKINTDAAASVTPSSGTNVFLLNSSADAATGSMSLGHEGTPTIDIDFTINGAAIQSVLSLDASGVTDLGGIIDHRHSDTAALGAHWIALRSRGTHSVPTIVQSGDLLSQTVFAGYDGTDYALAAAIYVYVDGTPGANDMPGRIIFATSTDGTQVPTEAMRISQDGSTSISKGNLAVSRSEIAGLVRSTCSNSDNTSTSSHANIEATTVSGGGDPYYGAVITGVYDWIWGQDHTDNSWKLGNGGPPSSLSNTMIKVDSASGDVSIPTGDLSVTRSDTGASVIANIINSQNSTSNYGAYLNIEVGGTSAGDQFTVYQNGSNGFTAGRREVTDQYLISYNVADLTSNQYLAISNAGEVTFPLQPSFNAYQTATDANAVGDGTDLLLGDSSVGSTGLTERFDKGGNFTNAATAGGVFFTAPLAGYYTISFTVGYGNLTSGHTSGHVALIGSTFGTVYLWRGNPGSNFNASNQFVIGGSILINLAAAETVKFQIGCAGSTKTVSILQDYTMVWGCLSN